METYIDKKTQICSKCGEEFEAHIGKVAGINIDLSRNKCPTCRKLLYEQELRDEAESKYREIANKREQWRKECGIPMRFMDSRFDKFNQKVDKGIVKAWQECKDFAETFAIRRPQNSRSMVLFSNDIWGVGKTYLVCSIAHAILDKWNNETSYCPVYFVSEPKLFLRVRSTFNRTPNGEAKHETEEDIYRQLTKVPLLILDDVGKEEVSDPRFVQRVLFSIIDGRYQNMLPIVITANLNPDQLDNHLGGGRGNSASISRLAEMTGNVFIELVGKDYRDFTNKGEE